MSKIREYIKGVLKWLGFGGATEYTEPKSPKGATAIGKRLDASDEANRQTEERSADADQAKIEVAGQGIRDEDIARLNSLPPRGNNISRSSFSPRSNGQFTGFFAKKEQSKQDVPVEPVTWLDHEVDRIASMTQEAYNAKQKTNPPISQNLKNQATSVVRKSKAAGKAVMVGGKSPRVVGPGVRYSNKTETSDFYDAHL